MALLLTSQKVFDSDGMLFKNPNKHVEQFLYTIQSENDVFCQNFIIDRINGEFDWPAQDVKKMHKPNVKSEPETRDLLDVLLSNTIEGEIIFDKFVELRHDEVRLNDETRERFYSLCTQGGIPSPIATYICTMGKEYPNEEFLHLSTEQYKYIYCNLDTNFHSRVSVNKALAHVHKKEEELNKPKTPLEEKIERLSGVFGEKLAEKIAMYSPVVKFYALPEDLLIGLGTPSGKGYLELLLNDDEIKCFDRQLELPESMNAVGFVYKLPSGREWAEIIDLDTQKRTPIKEYAESTRTMEQITNGYSVVKEYNDNIVNKLKEICQGNDEQEVAQKCQEIIDGMKCRYLLNEDVETMIQALEQKIQYVQTHDMEEDLNYDWHEQ